MKLRESEKYDKDSDRQFKKVEDKLDEPEQRKEEELLLLEPEVKKDKSVSKKKKEEPQEEKPEILLPMSKENKQEEISFWRQWRSSHVFQQQQHIPQEEDLQELQTRETYETIVLSVLQLLTQSSQHIHTDFRRRTSKKRCYTRYRGRNQN